MTVDAAARPVSPQRARRLLRRTAGSSGFVLGRVLADPVRQGRLKDTGWPPGLRVVVVLSVVGYAVLVLAAVLAPSWRRGGHLLLAHPDTTFPVSALPLVLIGMVLALSGLVTASLQLRGWWRAAVWVVVAALAGLQSDASVADPLGSLVWEDLTSLGLLAALAVLMVLRGGPGFRLLDYLLTLVLVGHLMLLAVLFRAPPNTGAALDLSLNGVRRVLPLMFWLATPAAMLAGAALVELTARSVWWVVTAARHQVLVAGHRRPSVLLALGAVAVVLARAGQLVWLAATSTDTSFRTLPVLLGVAETVVLVASAGGVLALAHRRSATGRGLGPEDVLGGWSRRSLPLALVLSGCFFGPSLLAELMDGLLWPPGWVRAVEDVGGPHQLLLGGILAVLVLAGCCAWAVRRGDELGAVLAASLAGYTGLAALNQAGALVVSRPVMLMALSGLALGVGGWLLVTRRLTARAAVALTVMMGLTLCWEYRHVLTEPLTAGLALSGVGVGLLAGLVWRLLTDNGWTRGGSARVPVAARVLLALASALFAATSAAVVSLQGGSPGLSLEMAEDSGDSQLGTALVLALSVTALVLAVQDGLRAPSSDGGRTSA